MGMEEYWKQRAQEGPQLLTLEEQKAQFVAERSLTTHCDLSFDAAVAKLAEFEGTELFPGVTKELGGRRVYFKVMQQYFFRLSETCTLSILLEESERFGVELTAIVAGGSVGMNNDWGAAKSWLKKLKKQLNLK